MLDMGKDKIQSEGLEEDIDMDAETCDKRKRPSEYLRRRCPMCFGGEIHDHSDNMYVFMNYFEH